MSEELKPCGKKNCTIGVAGIPDPKYPQNPNWFYAQCPCGFRGPYTYSEAEAIAAWNTRTPVKVKPLEWLERRNNMLEAGPYQVCLNGDPSDPDAMWRVRLHGRVICKRVKGVDRATKWAQTHHERRIMEAIAEARREALEEVIGAIKAEDKRRRNLAPRLNLPAMADELETAIRALMEKTDEALPD